MIEHNADGSINETGSSYSADLSLDICWGSEPSGNPAVLVSLYYKEGSEYKVAKAAYDSTPRGNNFYQADTAGSYCSSDYRFKKTITPSAVPENGFEIYSASKLLLLRIQPLYENTIMAVKPAISLPVQGKIITSIGKTETGVVRKIQVHQGYSILPTLLDFGLFSEDQI